MSSPYIPLGLQTKTSSKFVRQGYCTTISNSQACSMCKKTSRVVHQHCKYHADQVCPDCYDTQQKKCSLSASSFTCMTHDV